MRATGRDLFLEKKGRSGGGKKVFILTTFFLLRVRQGLDDAWVTESHLMDNLIEKKGERRGEINCKRETKRKWGLCSFYLPTKSYGSAAKMH